MKKFRLYYDKDREQDWLQKMSSEGWALKKFFLGVYTFVPCKPGEYIYQIDLLENWDGDKEDFAAFMEDSGVEVVSQWYRWVFLRKKAEDGPFEMYTDVESKINQYNRIKNFFLAALILEIGCFFIEINAALQTNRPLFWIFAILIGIVAIAFLRIVWRCQWKIEQLQRGK
ncbi:DUF2812 domain-containing protein [Acetivibrio mesophilus]|uniref:DUF2812 domain-containing protein n=1 Tax=Acetivibrio mesophilus TaxID=2487273 RepID=A0A4Q0I450_9FIRM|nr:DUF2812 domain-containing protein [Acetivibrio mesophilus]ODM27069.1 hypothetical protein A7W90_13085 [Clostridium sp. Bc-iso-3]RXE58485.1 DUF2812 domain-containing protein [Acetivibrio mesophilus]HHV28765.1 DUF2812 domain-containing protein [Clostridium sp.]